MKSLFTKIVTLFVILILSCLCFLLLGCTDISTPSDNDDDGSDNSNETPSETICEITSFDDATIDDDKIFMVVENNVESVSLSSKVQVVNGCDWKLYHDKLGEFEIPTRVAADKNAKKLIDGNNTFFILVFSTTDAHSKLYELRIYKSFAAKINYYDGDTLLKTETAYTGHEIEINYRPTIKGYVFNYWQDYSGNQIEKLEVYNDCALHANKTAKTYNASLNVNYGEELTENKKTITFGQSYNLPVPYRNGYSFLGWYYNSIQFTDSNGISLNELNEDKDIQLIAQWKANSYSISINKSHNELNASGEGSYDCDSCVTLTATNHLGYDFIGWFNGETLITNNLSYTLKMGATSLTYDAKWEVKEEMKPFIFTSNETELTITKINDKTVKSVIVPDYTTRIVSGALNGCNQLETLTIPFVGETLNSFNYNAVLGYIFGAATANDTNATLQYWYTPQGTVNPQTVYCYYHIPNTLRSVSITKLNKMPDNTMGIRKNAFFNCTNLTTINLPRTNSYINIDEYAFANCSSLTQIGNFDEVKSVGKFAFQNCTSLKSVSFSSKASFINESAFNGCTALDTVNFGENVLSIGKSAFEGCAVRSLVLSSKTTSIGEKAFYNCKQLTTIELSNNIISIGASAFNGCGLNSFVIPERITSIEANTFKDCPISSITIPQSVKTIGIGAFLNCHLKEIDLSFVVSIGNNAFGGCFALSKVSLSDSLTSIEPYAFRGCSFERITLPRNLTTISQGVFQNCTKIREIVVPENITSVESYAFDGCSALETISLTDKITSIGGWAFANCTALREIKLPTLVTHLASSIFENCTSLTQIDLQNINTIEKKAFKGCSSLQNINLSSGNSQWLCGNKKYSSTEITTEMLTQSLCGYSWQKV